MAEWGAGSKNARPVFATSIPSVVRLPGMRCVRVKRLSSVIPSVIVSILRAYLTAVLLTLGRGVTTRRVNPVCAKRTLIAVPCPGILPVWSARKGVLGLATRASTLGVKTSVCASGVAMAPAPMTKHAQPVLRTAVLVSANVARTMATRVVTTSNAGLVFVAGIPIAAISLGMVHVWQRFLTIVSGRVLAPDSLAPGLAVSLKAAPAVPMAHVSPVCAA